MMNNDLFLSILSLLLFADMLLTIWIIRHGGRELNKILLWLFRYVEYEFVLFGMKVGGVIYAASHVQAIPMTERWLLVVGYALLAMWNGWQVYKKLKMSN